MKKRSPEEAREIFKKVMAQKRLLKASEDAYYWIQRTQKDIGLGDDGTLEELKEALELIGVEIHKD